MLVDGRMHAPYSSLKAAEGLTGERARAGRDAPEQAHAYSMARCMRALDAFHSDFPGYPLRFPDWPVRHSRVIRRGCDPVKDLNDLNG